MKSIENSRKYLVGLFVLLPIIRAVAWWRLTGNPYQQDPEIFADYIYQPIHTHADGLIMGLLLANLKATEQSSEAGKGFLYSPLLLPLVFYVICRRSAVLRNVSEPFLYATEDSRCREPRSSTGGSIPGDA